MVQLEDLDDDCLLLLLDRLTPEELFKTLQVNKRLNRLAEDKIRVKIKAISLYESNRHFAECTHLDDDVQDKILVLETLLQKRFGNELLRDSPKRALFLSVLTKCSGIKTIDFGYCELPGEVLLEVVKRCPELECLKLSDSCVKEEDWHRVLDLVGCQIIHFVNRTFSSEPSEIQLLSVLAAKCPLLHRVEWFVRGRPTVGLLGAFKQLKSWVTFHCDSFAFTEFVFEDAVDELDIQTLDWSSLGNCIHRLSSLKLFELAHSNGQGVEFSGLKKLDFSKFSKYLAINDNESVACLVASQFPQLDEFCFNARAGLSEDDYDSMFQKMRSVKKLTIISDLPVRDVLPLLPAAAIHRLRNLNTIDLDILNAPGNWRPKEFLKQLEQYVDGIASLKKLSVDMRHIRGYYAWEKTVGDEVKRLKQKQAKVEVNLFVRPHCR